MLRKFWSPGKTLPRPAGPFSVGFVDYEWASGHMPISYTFARIYYPSIPSARSGLPDEGEEGVQSEWRGRSYWIPSSAYYPGYGYVTKVPWYIASPMVRLFTGHAMVWAVENAPLASVSHLPKMPLIVFSHGLGGMRTTYSTLCTDLASRGYVVAAIEHRDGSASMSVIQQDQSVIQYEHPPEEGFSGTREFRVAQIAHRIKEVDAAIDLLTREETPIQIWPQKNSTEAVSRDDLIVDAVAQIKSRIDHQAIAMAGHSFGGATSIFASQQDERIKAVLALDPWMFPFSPDFFASQQARGLPILVINSEFFQCKKSLEMLSTLLQKNRHLNPQYPSMQVTILGSSHMDQSDIPALIPDWFLRVFKYCGSVHPVEALAINTAMGASLFNRLFGMQSKVPEKFCELIWHPDQKDSAEKCIRVDLKC